MSSSPPSATAGTTEPAGKAELLSGLALFAGIAEDELAELVEVMRTVETPAGENVWSEGDEVDGLYVIVTGRTSVIDQLPSEREFELATLGPGGVLGEIPLLGGGTRWATVRAVEDTSFLVLGRTQFLWLLARATPGALTVRRRLLALACERLRLRHQALAEWLGGGTPLPTVDATTAQEPDLAPTPDAEYVLRLPFFRAFDRISALDVLSRGALLELPRGYPVLDEGAQTQGCWITISGAVEEVIRRPEGAIRVGLAGPGHAFGYLGLIDGQPSSVAAVTREQSRALLLSPDAYEALFDPVRLGAVAFREAIEHDLTRALRASLRPQSRLEAAR